MGIVIVAFGIAGIATLFGILVADMRASAAHQRWVEENNKRRHGRG